MFKHIRRPFRSSRALRHAMENTARNHWSKGLVSVWPRLGARKRNHNEGFHIFSGQSLLFYESNWPSRRAFSYGGTTKTLGFYRVPRFPSLLLDPPGLPAAKTSHENAVPNHSSKAPSRPLRARSAQGRWLGGRFGGASPTGDPATEPSGSALAVAERVG